MSTITRLETGARMSNAVIHNGVVYLAGVVGEPRGNVTSQTREVLAEIDRLLALAGSDKTRILRAQIWLAELLHDGQRELEAAEALQGAVDAMDGDKNVEYLVKAKMGRDPGEVRSRMHYFYAEQARLTGDLPEQRRRLLLGIRSPPKAGHCKSQNHFGFSFK